MAVRHLEARRSPSRCAVRRNACCWARPRCGRPPSGARRGRASRSTQWSTSLAGDDQGVTGRDRVDRQEGDAPVVLPDEVTGDLAVDDLGEDGRHGAIVDRLAEPFPSLGRVRGARRPMNLADGDGSPSQRRVHDGVGDRDRSCSGRARPFPCRGCAPVADFVALPDDEAVRHRPGEVRDRRRRRGALAAGGRAGGRLAVPAMDDLVPWPDRGGAVPAAGGRARGCCATFSLVGLLLDRPPTPTVVRPALAVTVAITVRNQPRSVVETPRGAADPGLRRPAAPCCSSTTVPPTRPSTRRHVRPSASASPCGSSSSAETGEAQARNAAAACTDTPAARRWCEPARSCTRRRSACSSPGCCGRRPTPPRCRPTHSSATDATETLAEVAAYDYSVNAAREPAHPRPVPGAARRRGRVLALPHRRGAGGRWVDPRRPRRRDDHLAVPRAGLAGVPRVARGRVHHRVGHDRVVGGPAGPGRERDRRGCPGEGTAVAALPVQPVRRDGRRDRVRSSTASSSARRCSPSPSRSWARRRWWLPTSCSCSPVSVAFAAGDPTGRPSTRSTTSACACPGGPRAWLGVGLSLHPVQATPRGCQRDRPRASDGSTDRRPSWPVRPSLRPWQPSVTTARSASATSPRACASTPRGSGSTLLWEHEFARRLAHAVRRAGAPAALRVPGRSRRPRRRHRRARRVRRRDGGRHRPGRVRPRSGSSSCRSTSTSTRRSPGSPRWGWAAPPDASRSTGMDGAKVPMAVVRDPDGVIVELIGAVTRRPGASCAPG